MVTMIGYEWVGVNRAWKNLEVRLEHGVSAERERGLGRSLTQRRRYSGSSRLPHPPGCPLKPGEGFDLGSAMLSAGRARCTGGGAEGPTSLQASSSPGPLHPLLGKETVSGCCRGHQSRPTPPPRLAAVPQLPSPTPKTAGREAGGGERSAAARLGAETGEGSDMKELGPSGVAGAGNPPASASPRAPHIWATGTAAPRRWGGGDALPTPSSSRKGEE